MIDGDDGEKLVKTYNVSAKQGEFWIPTLERVVLSGLTINNVKSSKVN